jgi:carboxyl-terminal processing protease
LKSDHFQDVTLQHYAFFNFSKRYLSTHTISKDMQVDDALLQQFKDYLKTEKIETTDKDFADNLDWTKAMLKKELFTSQFGQTLGNEVITEWDPQVQKALTFMPEALALENHTLPAQQKTVTAKAVVPGQNDTRQ